jgi:NTP pyrophosphatase (non-canonical NTP hydrolase)
MGYMTDGLTFNTLRAANVNRLPTFKNAKGEPAHSMPDGSDWSPAQWLQAVSGELGEYANLRKKFERGDIDEEEFRAFAKEELADIVTYLDILAFQLKIDLGKAVISKFNLVSDRVKSPIKIHTDGSDFYVEKLFKPGDFVHLNASVVKKENGRVKSVNGNTVFVVYHCNNEWDRYQEYTGAGTDISQLSPGWINGDEPK